MTRGFTYQRRKTGSFPMIDGGKNWAQATKPEEESNGKWISQMVTFQQPPWQTHLRTQGSQCRCNEPPCGHPAIPRRSTKAT